MSGKRIILMCALLLALAASALADKGQIEQFDAAVSAGNLALVSALVTATPTLAQTKTPEGDTPLHFAVQQANLKVIKRLLEADAKINARNAVGNTPLFTAITRGNWKAAEYLVAAGAEVNIPGKEDLLPLHAARLGGASALGLVRQLMRHGAKDVTGYLPVTMPPPQREGKCVLLPLGYIIDWLGGQWTYTARTRTVAITFMGKSCLLTLNSCAARVGEQALELPATPRIIGATLYIPMEFLVEGLNVPVSWDDRAMEVSLTHPQTAERLTFAVGDPAAAAAPKRETPMRGIHPVYDARRAYLLGGLIEGTPVDAPAIARKMHANEQYKLYTLTRYLGSVAGAMRKQGGGPSVQSFSPELMEGGTEVIGIAGTWNALPRCPRLEDVRSPEAMRQVKEILCEHRLTRAPVTLKQVLKVDLAGDGQEVLLVSAAAAGGRRWHSRAGNRPYSLVALLQYHQGQWQHLLLEGAFSPGEIARYAITGVLDVDGDGVEEVLVTATATDGSSVTRVYRIRDGNVIRLMQGPWGADEL